VELRGIEPRSGGAFSGLLRAQSALEFLGPRASADTFADRPSRLKVPLVPSTRTSSSGTLDDASYRVERSPGLTDFEARLSSEGEVVARRFGNYWFEGIVNEISPHPRPASPEATTTVETDQPLCSCQAGQF